LGRTGPGAELLRSAAGRPIPTPVGGTPQETGPGGLVLTTSSSLERSNHCGGCARRRLGLECGVFSAALACTKPALGRVAATSVAAAELARQKGATAMNRLDRRTSPKGRQSGAEDAALQTEPHTTAQTPFEPLPAHSLTHSLTHLPHSLLRRPKPSAQRLIPAAAGA
jgi:hypothetical protein